MYSFSSRVALAVALASTLAFLAGSVRCNVYSTFRDECSRRKGGIPRVRLSLSYNPPVTFKYSVQRALVMEMELRASAYPSQCTSPRAETLKQS